MLSTVDTLCYNEHLFTLQHTNAVLRTENAALKDKMEDLIQWKEKALKHFNHIASKRNKVDKDKKESLEIKKKLIAMEKKLQDRKSLELKNQQYVAKEQKLVRKIETLQLELDEVKMERLKMKLENIHWIKQLENLKVYFKQHIESLQGMQPQLVLKIHESNEKNHNTCLSPVNQENHMNYDINTLSKASATLIEWFRSYVHQVQQDETKAKSVQEARENEEIQSLNQNLENKKLELTQANQEKEEILEQLHNLQTSNAELQLQMADIKKITNTNHTNINEIRQYIYLLLQETCSYLRIMRKEIKKKFGYVPEVVAHAKMWSKILKIKDILLVKVNAKLLECKVD